MALNTLAIDIGKHSFHLFGIDDDGVIVSRKVSRLKLVATVDRLDPKIIAMEACGSAHHWGHMFQEAGRMVRLINPYFVRPFVRGSKNDATDAQAIFLWSAQGGDRRGGAGADGRARAGLSALRLSTHPSLSRARRPRHERGAGVPALARSGLAGPAQAAAPAGGERPAQAAGGHG